MSARLSWITLAALAATANVAVAQSAVDRLDLRREPRALRAGRPAAGGGADTDSFGRYVRYDGLFQTGMVTLQPDCAAAPGDPPPAPDDRCVALNPAPASTSFDLPDIGRLTIPGRSSHSLLCHWLTPIAYYSFENSTGAFQPNASFRLTPYVVVESEALNDPTLVNPITGLPFDGRLETSFAATYRDAQSLDPGHTASRQFSETRVCIAGFLSKQALTEMYGLTDAQAAAVFRRDMTLRFGLRGAASLVSFGSVTYGLRVVGD